MAIILGRPAVSGPAVTGTALAVCSMGHRKAWHPTAALGAMRLSAVASMVSATALAGLARRIGNAPDADLAAKLQLPLGRGQTLAKQVLTVSLLLCTGSSFGLLLSVERCYSGHY